MLKKINLVVILVSIFSNLYSQTYYLGNDSVSFFLKIETSKNDSIENALFKIKNDSYSNLFLCKVDFRNYVIYINSIDGPLIIGCGCEYGFNQDYPKNNNSSILKINKKDSLVFSIPAKELSLKVNRKMTGNEFLEMNKIIKIDYVLSNSPLLFLNQKYLREDFTKNKKNLSAFIPGVK